MNDVDEETCRLCGEITKNENFKMNFNDDCGGIKFKHCIEYYCRFDMGKLREFQMSSTNDRDRVARNFEIAFIFAVQDYSFY